jgi:hypothetical protein
MMTSQAFSQGIHLIEKSDFSLLRLYIEQEVSNASLQQLVETIQNSKDSEVSIIDIYVYSPNNDSLIYNRHVFIHLLFQFVWIDVIKLLVKIIYFIIYSITNKTCLDSFTEFIVHQQRRAITFAQQVSLFDFYFIIIMNIVDYLQECQKSL